MNNSQASRARKLINQFGGFGVTSEVLGSYSAWIAGLKDGLTVSGKASTPEEAFEIALVAAEKIASSE